MTEEEILKMKAAREQQFFEHQQQQMELQRQLNRAAVVAAAHQDEINKYPRQKYAVIVAVDEKGGFSKDGKIPWNYKEDFAWFKKITKGHVCVMGRATYDDINARQGDKGDDSVLPGRKCFVVTSTPLPRNNAIAIPNLRVLEPHLTDDDFKKTVFFIGGERVYAECLPKASTAYVTVVNKDAGCDRFFPTSYLLKHFKLIKTEHPINKDIKLTTWAKGVH
jgi:dihydrofolate reductase